MNKRTKLYNELLEASKAQIAENTANHKRRTTRFKRAAGRRAAMNAAAAAAPAAPAAAAAAPQVALDFLAIGDSWFEYPLYNNGPVFEETGIVSQVQLGSMGNPPPQILNYALHGQETTQMLSVENQEALISALQDSDQWLNEQTGLPDAILVSAGGDNLVGDQLAVYLDYGGGGLNAARFQGALDWVEASYMDLFAFRDIFAKGVPIIGHCYDYAIPNGVVPMCIETAWLQPSLEFAGYNYSQGLPIVSQMIDEFHDMLAKLAAVPGNNFILIDTRNTLVRNATSPTGWANEIHPCFGGFTALADKFLTALRGKFPGRI
jgi:hypothetical protein